MQLVSVRPRHRLPSARQLAGGLLVVLAGLAIAGDVTVAAPALAPADSAAAAMPARPAPSSRPLTLDLAAGARYHGWRPGLDGNIVTFETEGMRAYQLSAGLSVRGLPVLDLAYTSSFDRSPEQDAILAARRADTHTVEELLGRLDLLPLLLVSERHRAGRSGFWDRLLAARISYFEDLYLASTANAVDFAYFPFGAHVDFSTDPGVADGYTMYRAGERLSFKTRFRDLRVLVPVHVRQDLDGAASVVSLGYFRSRWEKASENVYFVMRGGEPVIQDTRLDAAGLAWSYEHGLAGRGLGFRVGGDWALFESTLDSPIPYSDQLDEDEGILYLSFRGDVRYRLGAGRGAGGGGGRLGGEIGARIEARFWDVERVIRDAHGEVQDSEHVRSLDRDLLYQVFVRLDLGLLD